MKGLSAVVRSKNYIWEGLIQLMHVPELVMEKQLYFPMEQMIMGSKDVLKKDAIAFVMREQLKQQLAIKDLLTDTEYINMKKKMLVRFTNHYEPLYFKQPNITFLAVQMEKLVVYRFNQFLFLRLVMSNAKRGMCK